MATVDIVVRPGPVPWVQGEHIATIGTTGTGKTYLMARLAKERQYVAVLRTKPDDIKFPGFKRVTDAKALHNPQRNPRLLIVPEFRKQAVVGAEVFDAIWEMGGWTVIIDELFYVHSKLGLQAWVEMLLTQGRSKHISVVVGMQRPVHVTRFALSEVTHIFSFRLEGRDQRTVRDIASDTFAEATGRVKPYHFAHWYVKGRSLAIGTADRLDRVLLGPEGRSILSKTTDRPASRSEDRASLPTG